MCNWKVFQNFIEFYRFDNEYLRFIENVVIYYLNMFACSSYCSLFICQATKIKWFNKKKLLNR